MLQIYAPDGMRGRLQGVFTVVVAGGPRLGDLRAGAMAAGLGADGGLGRRWARRGGASRSLLGGRRSRRCCATGPPYGVDAATGRVTG